MAKKPAPEESQSASQSGSQSESGSASQSGSQSESGSASEAGESSGDDTEAAEAGKKSGAQKKGSQRASGRNTGSQRSIGPAASVRPLGSGNELVPVICSECYEEFVFDSAVRTDTLTCPICEHQAARPDDAQLAVIAEKRKQEKTNFTLGLLLCIGSILSFGFWVIALRNPHAHENAATGMVPGVLAGVLFLACAGITLAKYESSRHDIYF